MKLKFEYSQASFIQTLFIWNLFISMNISRSQIGELSPNVSFLMLPIIIQMSKYSNKISKAAKVGINKGWLYFKSILLYMYTKDLQGYVTVSVWSTWLFCSPNTNFLVAIYYLAATPLQPLRFMYCRTMMMEPVTSPMAMHL